MSGSTKLRETLQSTKKITIRLSFRLSLRTDSRSEILLSRFKRQIKSSWVYFGRSTGIITTESSIICVRISTSVQNNRRGLKPETKRCNSSSGESITMISTSWKASSKTSFVAIPTTSLSKRLSQSWSESCSVTTTMVKTSFKIWSISLLTFILTIWTLVVYSLWRRTVLVRISAWWNVFRTSRRSSRSDL